MILHAGCVCVCAYVPTCLYIYTFFLHASLHLYGCLICTIHLFICLSTYEYPVHSVFNALIHMDACLGASGLNLTKRIQRNNTDPTIARRGLQNACQSGTEAQRIKNQARHVQEGLGNQRKTHWWQRNETSRLWLMQIESEWRLRGCSREFPNAINASSCRLSGLNSRYVVMWLNKPELMRLGTPSSFMSTHTHTLPCSWKDFMVVNKERRARDKESSESRALHCSQIWAGPESLFRLKGESST